MQEQEEEDEEEEIEREKGGGLFLNGFINSLNALIFL